MVSLLNRDGTYVRLNGHLKTFQGKTQLLVFSVRYVYVYSFDFEMLLIPLALVIDFGMFYLSLLGICDIILSIKDCFVLQAYFGLQ